MAKENLVMLHGQVQCAPKIYATNEGKLTKAMYIVKVLRRPLMGGQVMANRLFFDCPIILTKNEEMIKQTSELQLNDMVDIRGVLTTKEVMKTTICPHCSEKNSSEGNAVYITPIFIAIRERGITTEEGLKLLKERSEVSNLIMTIGNVCRDPIVHTSESDGKSYAQYQLAVNRKYRIKEDPADVKTDYPWVKTYGKQALEDSYGLKTGSMVYINGAIQTREHPRNGTCKGCGQEYQWMDTATEIVPYSTEYLMNCTVPEKETPEDEDGGEDNGES